MGVRRGTVLSTGARSPTERAIDRAEFKRLMTVLGADAPDAPEDELDVGFDVVDSDDDGAIDFNEFAAWWMNR